MACWLTSASASSRTYGKRHPVNRKREEARNSRIADALRGESCGNSSHAQFTCQPLPISKFI